MREPRVDRWTRKLQKVSKQVCELRPLLGGATDKKRQDKVCCDNKAHRLAFVRQNRKASSTALTFCEENQGSQVLCETVYSLCSGVQIRPGTEGAKLLGGLCGFCCPNLLNLRQGERPVCGKDSQKKKKHVSRPQTSCSFAQKVTRIYLRSYGTFCILASARI